ncbi:hypothetical protein [Streptomyces sp. YU58]|uniref:hypothetical protein n=1 Tax=Streptomyces sp. SX92 TaxID=3158972 RepID=UPI0027B8DB24|nr:hypothetical protein [Streptomyces coralus]WLW52850.1 hypothetical protein QU709_16285 [Streptomyces coralus]
MTYNLLVDRSLHNDGVAAALAEVLGLRVRDVDVADEGTDQDLRDWDAPVLCEKAALVGDVVLSLDIYVQDDVRPRPTERELASGVARVTGAVVLFPAEEALPSAYWLAAGDGLVTRARVHTSDDEVPRYTIDAVEAPVAQLPDVRVARIAEVVRELRIATPLTDTFAEQLRRLSPEQADEPGTPGWYARTRLGAWEKLVRQLAQRWAPSGWYPPDLYRERLESRDELERGLGQLPQSVRVSLQGALRELDALFSGLTAEDPAGRLRKELARPEDAGSAHGWWWDRRPDPLPW